MTIKLIAFHDFDMVKHTLPDIASIVKIFNSKYGLEHCPRPTAIHEARALHIDKAVTVHIQN